MKKFILLTFALLGWSFYEMSGGSEFQPPVQAAQASTMQTDEEAAPENAAHDILARASTEPQESDAADLVTKASAVVGEQEAELEKAVLEASLDTRTDATQPSASATGSAASDMPIVEVAGSRVNLREGPGTTNPVIVTLDGGTEAQKLESRDGWARIRISETGQEGWMAERLLTGV